jgi:hypothetical protein
MVKGKNFLCYTVYWLLTLDTVPHGHEKNFRAVCCELSKDLLAGKEDWLIWSHEKGWTKGGQ